jgi:hypothetical protein
MAVISLKPHILEYEVKIKEGYEDSVGDFNEGKTEWVGRIKCDAVPSTGKASEIQFEDGSVHSYSYTIYLNSDVREFAIGERVRLTLYGGAQKVFSVKGFQRYQLQSKLWV